MELRPLEIGRELARALDAGQLSLAAPFLDPECTYEAADLRLQGRDRILAAYRTTALASKRVFERVVFASTVTEGDDGVVSINSADVIEHRGEHHEHRSRQDLWISGGVVTLIVHHELPGEADALAAFCDRVGISL